jgi:acetylornithine deacetylase
VSRLTSTQILERLVAMPTVSRDSNLPLVAWVRDYLDGFGIRSAYVANEEGTKAT